MTAYTFDQLITFTRTSAATYVGSNGLVAVTPASRNLLTYTQEFDNAAWSKLNTVVSGVNAAVAPDGTLTADALVATAGTAVHWMGRTATVTAATAYTFSVYVKAGTSNFIQLLNTGDAQAFANFNVATGAVGTTGSKTTASIVSVGNGWYRCIVTFNTTASLSNDHRFYMVSSSAAAYGESWTATGTETIYVWGAQLEAASAASTYTRNNGGVYPPRFDYDPVTRAPRGLLIEEQRTNLLLRSEEFDNASWSKTGATVTANAVTSPDGTMDADKLVESSATESHYLVQAATMVAGTSYTQTVFAKAGERSVLQIASSTNMAGGGLAYQNFDLSSGALGGSSGGKTASIQNCGNGWYRCSFTDTAIASTSGQFIVAMVSSSASARLASYTGDGTSGIYLWGAQLEAGPFATSYIPTVASQVTRTADVAAITAPMFAPWYRQSEGTFVAKFDTISTLLASSALSVDDATNNNFIRVGRVNTTGRLRVFNGGASQADVLPANAPGWAGVVKIAAAFKVNDFAASVSGGTVATGTSGTIPAVTQLRLGASGGGDPINGHIQSIDYYPTRLTNAQIQALTA